MLLLIQGWTIATILIGILSFFNSDEETVGSLTETIENRQSLAKQSHSFNFKNPQFVELFGDQYDEKNAQAIKIETNTLAVLASSSSSMISSVISDIVHCVDNGVVKLDEDVAKDDSNSTIIIPNIAEHYTIDCTSKDAYDIKAKPSNCCCIW